MLNAQYANAQWNDEGGAWHRRAGPVAGPVIISTA